MWNKVLYLPRLLWNLYQWFIYEYLTVGEGRAMITGRPRHIRARHYFNLFFTCFTIVRINFAIAAFKIPSLWNVYIKVDKLYLLTTTEGQCDLFACLMGLAFFLYILFTYWELYFGFEQAGIHRMVYDLFMGVYVEKNKSVFFPEIANSRIQRQIGKLVASMRSVYFVLFFGVELICISFIVRYTYKYGLSVYTPHIILDTALCIYYANTIFHFHLFMAYIVLMYVTVLGICHHEHTISMNRTLRTLKVRGQNWCSLVDFNGEYPWMTSQLFINKRLHYHYRNFAYVNRCNGFVRLMSASYTLMNIFNPSCMLCYVILKKEFFGVRQFYCIVIFLFLLLGGVPLLYYFLSFANHKLTGPPKKLIHTIQHNFRGAEHLHFKVFILSYYECISGKKAPGFAVGVSSSASKLKAFRMTLTGAVYFLFIWDHFVKFYGHSKK